MATQFFMKLCLLRLLFWGCEMVDYVEATNEICKRFDEYWQANAAGIVGYVPEVRFPRIVYPTPINPAVHWARLSIQSVMAQQSAFCGYGNGAKKYEESGLVFVQLFGPRNEVEAAEQQDKFAQIARAAFRGISLPGKVWFRNARINNVGDEDQMIRLNVVADYYYNEIA